MNGGRPENIPAAEADIFIGDVLIDHVRLHNRFEDYIFRVPAGKLAQTAEERVIFTIDATTWNPKAAGISEDNRDMGAAIDRITVEKAAKP